MFLSQKVLKKKMTFGFAGLEFLCLFVRFFFFLVHVEKKSCIKIMKNVDYS